MAEDVLVAARTAVDNVQTAGLEHEAKAITTALGELERLRARDRLGELRRSERVRQGMYEAWREQAAQAVEASMCGRRSCGCHRDAAQAVRATPLPAEAVVA